MSRGKEMKDCTKIILVVNFYFLLLQSQKIMRDDKENISALKQEEKKQTWFS
jgi:hypothetical protein